jgi:hypothetical protein
MMVAKANNENSNGRGTTLTYNEPGLLMTWVVLWQSWSLLIERARMSEVGRDLTHRAAAAALTEDIKAVRETAQALQ